MTEAAPPSSPAPEQPAAAPESQTQPDPQDEIARLRAERDALAAELDRRKAPREHHRHGVGQIVRRTAAALLVLVFALLLPLGTALGWSHRTIFDEKRYLATVGPLGSNPTVTTAVAAQLTDQIYAAVNPEATIKDVLPPRAAFLASPISGQVKNFFGDQVQKVFTGPRFAEFWTNANRYAHAQLVAILDDKSAVIKQSGDTVVLNLVPLLNAALQAVQPQVSAIVGKNVPIPTISGDELPSVACEKVSAALSRPLPQTCGQIPLFPAEKLHAVQQSVTRFDRLTTLSLVLLPVLFVGALLVSPRRRRTFLQLTIGGALTVVLLRRVVFYLDERLTGAAKPENRAAAHVIISTVLDRLVTITVWILVVALVLAALALLSGPYRWARALRSGVARGAVWTGRTTVRVSRGLSRQAAGVAGDDDVRRWVAAHRGLLQAAGAAVAFVLLFVLNLSLWSVLILAAVLAVYELGVVRLAALAPDDADEPYGAADAAVDADSDDPGATGSPPAQRTPAEPAEPAEPVEAHR